MKLVNNEVSRSNKQVKTRATIHCVELSTVPTSVCQLKFVQSFGRTMTFYEATLSGDSGDEDTCDDTHTAWSCRCQLPVRGLCKVTIER